MSSEERYDALHVKVMDVNADRDFGNISDIRTKLEQATGKRFLVGIVVNTGPIWENNWTKFNIRKW